MRAITVILLATFYFSSAVFSQVCHCPLCDANLTCPSGSDLLYPGGDIDCICCASCVTPEIGDTCYRTEGTQNSELSCGSQGLICWEGICV